MFDEEVGIIQNFLKKIPAIYPEGFVTKYFGRLTLGAVKRFQANEGIESVGIVGPKTRAKINQYLLAAPSAAGLSHRSENAQPATPATPATPAVPKPGAGEPAESAIPATSATPGGEGAPSPAPTPQASPSPSPTASTTPSVSPTPTPSPSPADTTPPIISNIQAINITPTSATITWTTNEPANGTLHYDAFYSLSSTSTPLKIISFATTTLHSINLSSLKPAAIYYYQVISRDYAGNSATSSEHTFITPALPISPSPTLLPSLTILGFNSPVSANAGQSINLGILVRNNGKAPAPASTVRATFIDNQATLNVPPLNVESTAWVYWTAAIPQNASGKYIFWAYCDPDNQIVESSENDNGGGTEINVMPLSPILSPSPSPSPTSAPVSYKFNIGDRVQTTDRLNVRVGPSLPDTILGTQSLGSLGTVVDGPISADGFIWWQINYDIGADGWSVENYLQKIDISSEPAPESNNSYSIDLEEDDQSYLSILHGAYNGLDLAGSFTIEAWVNLESSIIDLAHDVVSIIDKSDPDINNGISEYSFTLNEGYSIEVGVNTADAWGYSTTTPINLGVWNHFAAVYDMAASKIRIYWNGVQYEEPGGNPPFPDIVPGTSPFYVGYWGAQVTEQFDGKIDDLRIWNTAKSSAEISENYRKELTGTESGLVAYWKFNNELVDGKVKDYSPNGNHLTPHGGVTFSANTPF